MSVHCNDAGTIKDLNVKLDGFTINGIDRVYRGKGKPSGDLYIVFPKPLVQYKYALFTKSVAENRMANIHTNTAMLFDMEYAFEEQASYPRPVETGTQFVEGSSGYNSSFKIYIPKSDATDCDPTCTMVWTMLNIYANDSTTINIFGIY